ncbi:TetR/AcrR family transcriptional regulator [Streptomyces sp. NPDC058240]|uniref:TetR/AcrR family transcriptional regulator n=1 Tax=Streptomyces sp. NPDC058240 TaxID=3346396 RepID=UPI0036E10988
MHHQQHKLGQDRQVPRPSKPLLTRDLIMRTALRLVDEHGPQALSTNRIAAELGVKGPSLYNHISGRSEVIEGLRELLTADIDFSAADLRPWPVACERLACSYRDSFAAHPRTVPLLAAQPIQSAEVLGAYEQVFGVLREAGWPENELFPVVRAFEYVALGAATDNAVGVKEAAEPAFNIGITALIHGLEQRLKAHLRATATE